MMLGRDPGEARWLIAFVNAESVRAVDAMIKAKGCNIDIEVDGGITPATIRTAYDAGARVFVAGSSVFKASDPAEAMQALRKACE